MFVRDNREQLSVLDLRKRSETAIGRSEWGGAAFANQENDEVSTYDDQERLRTWSLLPDTDGPVPTWFADLLQWRGGMRIDDFGRFVSADPEEQIFARDRLRRSLASFPAADPSPFVRYGRWLIVDPSERPLAFHSTTKPRKFADELLGQMASETETRNAFEAAPTHPLIHLALARFETHPGRAEFLRRYSLDRFPTAPSADLLRRAAELLEMQPGQEAVALGLAERALAADPQDAAAQVLRDRLRGDER